MPWVNEEMCVGCGLCVAECPVDAISLQENDTALINDDGCIRCGHCHDVCPQEAVRHDSEKIPIEVEAAPARGKHEQPAQPRRARTDLRLDARVFNHPHQSAEPEHLLDIAAKPPGPPDLLFPPLLSSPILFFSFNTRSIQLSESSSICRSTSRCVSTHARTCTPACRSYEPS